MTIRLYFSASSRMASMSAHLAVEMHREDGFHLRVRLQVLPGASPGPCCRCARRCRRTRSSAPACEIASVVAMKVFGTVTTVSPLPMPAAIRAKRRASVPLPTPTQCSVPQKAANSFSKPSTSSPPMKWRGAEGFADYGRLALLPVPRAGLRDQEMGMFMMSSLIEDSDDTDFTNLFSGLVPGCRRRWCWAGRPWSRRCRRRRWRFRRWLLWTGLWRRDRWRRLF